MLQLASFINDWWLQITKFIHEMNQIVRFLIVGILIISGMFLVIKLLKKSKNDEKYKIGYLIFAIIFVALGILIATI